MTVEGLIKLYDSEVVEVIQGVNKEILLVIFILLGFILLVTVPLIYCVYKFYKYKEEKETIKLVEENRGKHYFGDYVGEETKKLKKKFKKKRDTIISRVGTISISLVAFILLISLTGGYTFKGGGGLYTETKEFDKYVDKYVTPYIIEKGELIDVPYGGGTKLEGGLIRDESKYKLKLKFNENVVERWVYKKDLKESETGEPYVKVYALQEDIGKLINKGFIHAEVYVTDKESYY